MRCQNGKHKRHQKVVVWVKQLCEDDMEWGKVAKEPSARVDTSRGLIPKKDHGKVARIPDVQHLHRVPSFPACGSRFSSLEVLAIDEFPYHRGRKVVSARSQDGRRKICRGTHVANAIILLRRDSTASFSPSSGFGTVLAFGESTGD